MAWGSAGKAIEAANQERGAARSAARQGSNLDERYPMYVVPVQEVKTWDRWVAHQDLLARGKLKVFDESMWGKVFFVCWPPRAFDPAVPPAWAPAEAGRRAVEDCCG